MLGLMQDWALTVDRIIDHAALRHGAREVVSREERGEIVRITYADVRRRAMRVSRALRAAGVVTGDRVATLAWNNARHLETWYGIMGIGAICHTLNPRLHHTQLGWIIEHAGSHVIMVEAGLLPLLERALDSADIAPRIIAVFGERDNASSARADRLTDYERWIADVAMDGLATDPEWGGFDERTACGLCYTSGTTGDPKGVLYSHRSNFLHTLMTLQADLFGLSASDVVMPLVPMFHANAWGMAFSAPAVGAKLVLPGSKLDPASILELLDMEHVTFSAGVPTIWQALLHHLDGSGRRLKSLQRIVVAGSACPPDLVTGYRERHGVEVRHAWGMTELSPIGTVGTPPAAQAAWPFEQQLATRMKQGRPPLGVELQVRGGDGAVLPEDGDTAGHLFVKGLAAVKAYYRAERDAVDDTGFFDTGDIATIDADGAMQITDRAKDIIKSGGEWISSIAIETIATGHPAIAMAAVVAVPHERWGERPLLLLQLHDGARLSPDAVTDYLNGKIPSWWMPQVAFVPDIPLGATGKVDKKLLRQRHAALPRKDPEV